MIDRFRECALAIWLVMALAPAVAVGQQRGGVLQVAHRDSPASMSILEEVTISTVAPMMAVFSNLVIFNQQVPQNTLQSIVPDLAKSWSWSEDGTQLTFQLREGVKWHDGRRFTANDVQCTWDMLLGKAAAKFRINPRKSLVLEPRSGRDQRRIRGDFSPSTAAASLYRAARFRLFAGLSLSRVAAGHAAASDRHRAVQIRLLQAERSRSGSTRNPDYWKTGRPYLDGIEWTIIPNRSTALLAFAAGKVDMTFPYEVTIPLLKDIKSQAPEAICELRPRGVAGTLIVNREAPPFDNPDLRRAMALTIDRKAFIDVLSEGKPTWAAAMLPPPEGFGGCRPSGCANCPAMTPTWKRAARRRAKSCSGSATGPTTRSR